jgi:G3E family GTPase
MAGTAVAINEFGPVPLDHELIDHGADRTVVLANGCLCCNLAGDMEQAVMRLFSRRQVGEVPQFARLLIEPSGLSDPAPIMQTILRNPIMSRAFRLETVVTTVDAAFAEGQLARHPETRKQISLADHLVLTKPDLTDTEAMTRLRAALVRLNPIATLHVASHGAVDAASLFPPTFFDRFGEPTLPRKSPLMAEAVDSSSHVENIVAVTLTADAPLSWQAVDLWLRALRLEYAERLLRVKGILNIAGAEGPIAVHGVHHVLHAPVALENWPYGPRRSRLLLIVQNLPGDTLPHKLQTRWSVFLERHAAASAPSLEVGGSFARH